ncbi:MAG: RNA-guided pseudouridylation complex pseudouridine synthase subunit Cbf5, partial [Thermoplasmatales archaeon]|nr:RNA-guided pseudouridylation complex pseudouridine synthase subunit Cbf5 [Thermoplasmatales archaeon]
MADKKHVLPSDKKRKRLIRVQAKTNPNYGKSPNERSVKELLSCSMINLDKPSGPTSHQIDAWLKEILEVDKV